ncbi:MAG: alanine racemase [Proteobacteria bacterium]|nr:alanine racemase [Pseudomonadota bacterium]
MAERPTCATINLDNLKANYLALKASVDSDMKVMAVVKANAYGHGDTLVAAALEGLGCDWFGVAMPKEGMRLRDAGVKSPIIVLGGLFQGQEVESFTYDLTPVIFDIESARKIDKVAGDINKRKSVHVKIDTGMGRLGILPADVEAFFEEFKSLENLDLEGIMSHYSDMEVEDKSYSQGQLDSFLTVIEKVREMGFTPPLIHMSNSAAIVDFPQRGMNMIRAGLMLYGAYPARRFEDKIALKQVMELKSSIVQLKSLSPGSSVSYGREFVTEKKSLIAVVPAGYVDGIPRRLSGRGEALVRGVRVPIVGAVCMDMTMLDVTGVRGVERGDEVVFIGTQGTELITALDLALSAGTISYEILCNINARVTRVPE